MARESTKSLKQPDEELTKAFAELHEKVIDTTQKLQFADMQIESLKRTKQHAELTIKEVGSLTGDTKTYESVGRMFVLGDLASTKIRLNERIQNADEKVKNLENNKTYLQKNLKDSKSNLNEMIQQRQNRDTSG